MTLTEKFWARVDKRDPDECWPWTGNRMPDGRGRISYAFHKYALAPRLSWEIHNGIIPDGMCVCHRCDNPPCVNPAHLFLGTDADNWADMRAKGRHFVPRLVGERHHSSVTRDTALAVRTAYALGGVSQRQLAARHGINTETISRILRGKHWATKDLGPLARPDRWQLDAAATARAAIGRPSRVQ